MNPSLSQTCDSRLHIDRVVFLELKFPELGGRSAAVASLSRALAASGKEVQHLAIYPGDPSTEFDVWNALPHETLHRRPVLRGNGYGPITIAGKLPLVVYKRISRTRGLRRLRRRIERLGRDTAVIFPHVDAKMLLAESGYRRGADGPWLVGQHHEQYACLADEPFMETALRTQFSDIDLFVALTDPEAEQFGQLIGVPSTAIANAVDPAPPRRTQKEPLAVVLARFSHEKQLPLLVEMFAASTKETRRWRLEIFGEGDDEPAIRAAIRRTGCEDRVRLMGRTNDPASVYARASINLVASKLESFGLTIVEAARVGVPSIAFDCSPGIHGLLEDGAGIPVSDQDQEAYVEALKHLMADATARQRAGRIARERSARFSPDAIAIKWERALTEMVEGPVHSTRRERPSRCPAGGRRQQGQSYMVKQHRGRAK